MTDKTAITDYPISPALAARWSPRAFASTPVDDAQVNALFEAARWSPSASNMQPWAFIHAAHGTPDFERLAGCLKEANAVWASKAGILVLAIARTVKADGTANAYARYDLGQAVAHLTFQATALGLHVHQMAGFDADKARSDLGIPADHEAVTAIAIGRLGDAADLPPPLQEREAAARTRNPAATFVFAGRWGRTG